ncbi:ABC transporter substrate binding protein [uncultured Pseudodesulfovibrio sp.]|uniref:ABC transporter substrate-binding protein n=1 Tax=uncultured Pseudodesulfovibrio sp. TaxID=2035858 RepID=UPI0029C5FFBE|nr:ABC transporter substrate binding protein [uncultured Pseudodesulfovibrio sp.]
MPKYMTMLLCLLLLPAVALASSQTDVPKIMVINSYHAASPWVTGHNTALKADLEDSTRLIFFDMNTKRLPKSLHQAQAARARAAIEKERPDLLVLTDDYALKSLGNIAAQMHIPVVFLGINNNPRTYLDSMMLATGVLERPLLKRSIVYIREILGDSFKSCLILFDDDITAQTILEQVFKKKHSLVFDETVTDIRLLSRFEDWKQSVLNAKKNGYGAIILGLYHTLVDDRGRHVDAEQVARWTSKHSPVPVFGFWDFSVGKGLAMGGLILAAEPQGREAAKLVRRILNGQSPRNIQPVMAEQGHFIFSLHELKRWRITLPDYFDTPMLDITFVE